MKEEPSKRDPTDQLSELLVKSGQFPAGQVRAPQSESVWSSELRLAQRPFRQIKNQSVRATAQANAVFPLIFMLDTFLCQSRNSAQQRPINLAIKLAE